MNLDEMKRLAEIVTASNVVIKDGKVWIGYSEGRGMAPSIGHLWSPSLTGEDWQQAQALQCIVAAFNVKPVVDCMKDGDEYHFSWARDMHRVAVTGSAPDLLTASIAALLAATPSAVENL